MSRSRGTRKLDLKGSNFRGSRQQKCLTLLLFPKSLKFRVYENFSGAETYMHKVDFWVENSRAETCNWITQHYIAAQERENSIVIRLIAERVNIR